MKKLGAFALAVAAVALLAMPVLAQDAPSGDMQGRPSGDMQGKPSGGMQGKPSSDMHGDMHGMKMAKPAKKMGMKTASAGKRSCSDYAWQSQDQKDCESGKKMPPMGR